MQKRRFYHFGIFENVNVWWKTVKIWSGRSKDTKEQYEAEVINEVRMKFGKPMDNVDVRFELQYIKNLKAHLSKT